MATPTLNDYRNAFIVSQALAVPQNLRRKLQLSKTSHNCNLPVYF